MLEHHILLLSCLDAYREWNVVTCNSTTNMYSGFFVVEHKMGMFLHPHANKFRIIVVIFEGLYCHAAIDVTDVLVTIEEVPCELLPSFTHFQDAFSTYPNVDES